jgi:hypothetical protein
MSGGSTQTTQTMELPQWYEDYTKYVTDQAMAGSQIGYVPYMGPDVAAFTPMQQAAFDGTNMAASAYGLPTASSTGLPQATQYSNGMMGYSSAPLYNESLANLQKTNPQQYSLLMGYSGGKTK